MKPLLLLAFFAAFFLPETHAQCSGTVLSLSAANPSTTGTTGSWTVPSSGPYKIRITAKGAQGGNGGSLSAVGLGGATVQGDFIVATGQVLSVVAGAPGGNGANQFQGGSSGGGGGGASGVYVGGTNFLIAAGGGGSAGGQGDNGGDRGGNGLSYNGVPTCGFSSSRGGFGGGGYGSGAAGGLDASGRGNSGGGGGGGYTGGCGGRSPNSGSSGGSFNQGTNQSITIGNSTNGGQITIECLGAATFGANISATQPACGFSNGSLSIDLTGDADGSTSGGVEYAIVLGSSFSGSPTFADITADPFTVNSGFGTGAGTFTVRVRLKYNPTIYTDYTYSITVTTQSTWYMDADGDGYYTGSGISACTSPGAGYTTTVLGGGDCHDDNTAIHPDAQEVCNGIDDNCDGQIDEGTSMTTSIISSGNPVFCNGGSVNLTAAIGNNAIQLDGTSQYVITPNLTSYFPSSSFTIELWFKANSDGVIVSEVGQPTINTNWHDSHIELLPDGHVMVRVWNLNSVDLGAVTLGTWNHAVIRYNAATSILDGALNSTISASNVNGVRQTPSANGAAQYWAFGAADNSNLGSGKYFNGQLDEIRIWNTAISNAQVAANYNKSISPNATGLVAYYKADETTGNIAADATANAANATLFNGGSFVASGNALNSPSYLWSNAATTQNISPATSGGYYVTTTVSAACQATSATVNVVVILDSVLYVNAAAAAGGNGTSWGTSFKYLQDAINTAKTNSCVKQIWVAKGTYYPTTDSTGNASPTDNRTKTFFIKNGIALYGGFAGNELLGYDLSLRDFTNNQTILSGDVDGTPDVVTGSGQTLTITGNAGNAYHVVFNSQVAGTMVLDGFTVTGGNANGSAAVDRNGGGMYNDNSSLIVNHCIVSGNSASTGGGLYYIAGGATVTASLFSRNTGGSGGGMAGRSSFTLDHCQFTGNNANSSGGGLNFISSGSSSFTNCRFTGNYSAGFGGGVFSGRPLTLVSCKIDSNTAQRAGGLAQLTQNITMTNCTIKNNASISQTGGIEFQGVPNAILTNCEVSGNTCRDLNGAILNGNFGTGSANPQLSLINCTVANNSSGGGYQAVYTFAASSSLKATTILKNTIVAGNPGGNFTAQTPGFVIVQSQGNNLDDDGTSGFTNGANGDLVNVNPHFKSATDVHLVSCSPAVNAGDNTANNTTLDLDGKPRKVGVIDMGAYENQGVDTSTTAASICPSQLPYSWNGNSYSSAGTYYVHFTSVSGCDSVAALNLIVNQTTSDTTVSACNKYSWNGINPTVSGTYTWHGTTAAGCDSIATLHLTILSIANTFSKTDAGCYNSATGSIQIQVANSGYVGTPPYTYRVGVTGLINSTTNVFNNLKAGSYRAYIRDAVGCIGVAAPIVVAQQPPVTASVSATSITCYGANDGTIAVTNMIGNPPFMYMVGTTGSYRPFTPPLNFTGLRAGSYRIYLQDNTGCTGALPVADIVQANPVVVNYITTQPTCSNPKGSISLSLPGNATGTFKLNPGGNYTSQYLYTNLAAGTYYGYAKDAGGCTGRSAPILLSPATGCIPFARMATTNDVNAKQSFEVILSPNPSRNYFTLLVHGNQTQPVTTRVLDVNGKVVYSAKGLPAQVFTFGNELPNGLYMVEVRQGEEVKIVKAVKMRN